MPLSTSLNSNCQNLPVRSWVCWVSGWFCGTCQRSSSSRMSRSWAVAHKKQTSFGWLMLIYWYLLSIYVYIDMLTYTIYIYIYTCILYMFFASKLGSDLPCSGTFPSWSSLIAIVQDYVRELGLLYIDCAGNSSWYGAMPQIRVRVEHQNGTHSKTQLHLVPFPQIFRSLPIFFHGTIRCVWKVVGGKTCWFVVYRLERGKPMSLSVCTPLFGMVLFQCFPAVLKCLGHSNRFGLFYTKS